MLSAPLRTPASASAEAPDAARASAERAGRLIADRVIADARFQFIDPATQARYASLAAVPVGVNGLRRRIHGVATVLPAATGMMR